MMELNCTLNCIALVKAKDGPNLGRFVQCIRLIPDQLWRHADGTERRLPTWELDGDVIAWDGARHRFCPDDKLRPIDNPRDDDVDEMVKRLGAPGELTPVLVGCGGEA